MERFLGPVSMKGWERLSRHPRGRPYPLQGADGRAGRRKQEDRREEELGLERKK